MPVWCQLTILGHVASKGSISDVIGQAIVKQLLEQQKLHFEAGKQAFGAAKCSLLSEKICTVRSKKRRGEEDTSRKNIHTCYKMVVKGNCAT